MSAATKQKAELKRQAHRAIATVAEVLGRDPKRPLPVKPKTLDVGRKTQD